MERMKKYGVRGRHRISDLDRSQRLQRWCDLSHSQRLKHRARFYHWHLNILYSQASSSNVTAAHCFDGAIAGVGDDDDNA